MVKFGNFANVDIASLPDEFEFERCTFHRTAPDLSGAQAKGHRLWPGDDRPRTFRKCNMINCEPPPGSTLIECNTAIIESGIPSHTEELVIDGQVEDVRQYHNRTVHARYTESGYDRSIFRTEPEDY